MSNVEHLLVIRSRDRRSAEGISAGPVRSTGAPSREINGLSDTRLLKWLAGAGRRPNILVVCSEHAVALVLRRVMRCSVPPVAYINLPGSLELPLMAGGTLVLNDVGKLALQQQIALYDWMKTGARNTQIISLTRTCPFARVKNGEFLEDLFYHLNVVRLDIKDQFGRPRKQAAEEHLS